MEEIDKRKSWLARCQQGLSRFLKQRLGWSKRSRLLFHYMSLITEQLAAILPLTLLQVLVLAIFFHKTSSTPAIDAAGLLSAVAGLVLFLEGLRVAVMPMAMLVGNKLPVKLKLPWVLLVAFCLGVLVTYAEPAIAAIRPLAKLVDPQSAPYLYYMMNQQQEILVLAIGIGVGLASVVGTLKFLSGISIKPFIAGSLLPTVGLACYMQWGNPHLQPILGVAWDCGGVTTGPVTVPILLSLGVGVMKAQRQKQMAFAVLEDAAVKQSEGNTFEGFGIVTLASLLPVLAVECMAIITGATCSYEYVLEQASLAASRAATEQPSIVDTSPVKEVMFGLRAISPLIVALVLLVVVVLRQPLPNQGFIVDEEGLNEDEDEDEIEQQQRQQQQQQGLCEGSRGSKTASRAWGTGDSAFDEAEVVVGRKDASSSSGSISSNNGGGSQAAALKDVEMGAEVQPAADRSPAQDVAAAGSSQVSSSSAAAALPAARTLLPAAAARPTRPARPHIPKMAAAIVAAAEGDEQDYFEASITGRSSSSIDVGLPSSSRSSSWATLKSGLPLLLPRHSPSAANKAVDGEQTCAAAADADTAAAAVGGSGIRGCMDRLLSCVREYSSLLIAMVMCQVGMILFNLGLTYGMTALGDMTGSTLPSAFMAVPYEPNSPYYSFAGGVTLAMVTVFLLGFLATNAEPALNVLGQTVETLSNRKFTKRLLIYAVCVGVAVGMCAGATKILFQLPLLYFILAKYAVASGLTCLAKEAITAVAWDSAGVTTGPVTVPFVMAIGVGFSKAVGAPEGFGMLTVMSVAPIISVLLTSLLRKPVKRAASELARLSKVSLARMSRRSNSLAPSTEQQPVVVDFAAELQANPNWAPGLARSSPMGLARSSPMGLARVSRSISRTSRPLQPIGEHPAGYAEPKDSSSSAAAAAAGDLGSRLCLASAPPAVAAPGASGVNSSSIP